MLLVHAYIEVTALAAGIDFYCRGLDLVLKCRLSRAGLNSPARTCRNFCWPTGRLSQISAQASGPKLRSPLDPCGDRGVWFYAD